VVRQIARGGRSTPRASRLGYKRQHHENRGNPISHLPCMS
jgi:hypothetical protein